MDNFTRLAQLNQQNTDKALTDKRHKEMLLDNTNTQEVIVKSFAKLVEYLDRKVSKTEVVNQLREIGTPDVENVVTALASLHDTLKKHKNVDLSQVTSVMQGVLDEVKQIPKENPKLPEQKFVDYSKQLVQLEKSLQSVEKAIKAQELKVDAPVVNVPETVVNVDKPDLAPIEKSISTSSKDVVKAVKGIKMPEFKTKSIEDLLKKTNKLLDGLPELMPSGGGGGGSSWPAINSAGTPLPLNLDADGKLIVASTGGGAGTEYTEGDTDATFTGTISLVEGAANTAVTLKQPTQPTDTQPVSAASLPLPTGAATAANQQTDALTDTQLRATPVPVSGTVAATQSGTWTVQPGNTANTTAWKVDGSAVTQPVSGTFWQATQPVSLASVPSHAVTNAGTFATQAAQSGTWNIGTVTTLTGITNNVNTVEVAPTTILNGNKNVTTAGTRVTLASSTSCKSVTIKAKVANTGTIYVGDTSVSSSNGFALAAGETVSLDIANLNTVNLDASVSGEGVTYVGVN